MKLRSIAIILLFSAPAYTFAQGAANCNMPTLNATGMKEVRESIAKPDTDERRLEVAKNITNAHCMSAEQVTLICRQFSSEDTKLEFAKFAIDHTYDRENYAKVMTVFRKESNKRDLASLVKTRQ